MTNDELIKDVEHRISQVSFIDEVALLHVLAIALNTRAIEEQPEKLIAAIKKSEEIEVT